MCHVVATRKNIIFILVVSLFLLILCSNIYAQPATLPIPRVNVNLDQAKTPKDVTSTLQVLFILTVIALAPSILIMMTSFTRIIVVLQFLRSALGMQQTPQNQILIGLALFLTLFIMTPVFNNINENAIKPYNAGQITQEQAIGKSMEPIRTFMLKQTYPKDIALFMEISKSPKVASYKEVPNEVLIPAFIIGELKKGFMIGFIIYIPFIVIDMIVASTLMSMGMMMLPPVTISLPFKILLFIMVDGWNLVIGQLVKTFR